MQMDFRIDRNLKKQEGMNRQIRHVKHANPTRKKNTDTALVNANDFAAS